MFSGLSKSAIWPATVIVLGVLGCVTALAITGHMTGTDALPIITLITGGVIGTASAHVGAQAATNAATATSTAQGQSTAPTAATGAAGATPAAPTLAAVPAAPPAVV